MTGSGVTHHSAGDGSEGGLRFANPPYKKKKAKQIGRTSHASRRRQQIPDRKRCGDGDGRIAAPLLDAGAAVGGIAGSRLPAEEDRGDGRGAIGLPRLRAAWSGSSTSIARIAAPISGSAATRNAASAASITAGSSTPTAAASTCRPPIPTSTPKDLIRIKSYPVREWGDMVWAYMGPAGEVPELPDLEMALVPASHRYVSKKWQDCNWVQALEGSIDTAHFTFAHLVLRQGGERNPRHQEAFRQSDCPHEFRPHALDRGRSAARDQDQSA